MGHIENGRVHELASQAARVTGKSQTGAIEEALERLLRDHEVDPDPASARHTVDLVRSIAAEYRADPGHEREPRHVADLFDEETGWPR